MLVLVFGGGNMGSGGSTGLGSNGEETRANGRNVAAAAAAPWVSFVGGALPVLSCLPFDRMSSCMRQSALISSEFRGGERMHGIW